MPFINQQSVQRQCTIAGITVWMIEWTAQMLNNPSNTVFAKHATIAAQKAAYALVMQSITKQTTA
jgi:hypothetical protein